MRAVNLNRSVADPERLSDRPIGETLNDTIEHLALTRGKPVERRKLRQTAADRGWEGATGHVIVFRLRFTNLAIALTNACAPATSDM